mmetsp:Transcript_8572/g.15515  ORF Transcript_8572/g.15515 Transcript_8572/m.15515 type:complete len:82 (-) Transcript_8572:969-1214(-)
MTRDLPSHPVVQVLTSGLLHSKQVFLKISSNKSLAISTKCGESLVKRTLPRQHADYISAFSTELSLNISGKQLRLCILCFS